MLCFLCLRYTTYRRPLVSAIILRFEFQPDFVTGRYKRLLMWTVATGAYVLALQDAG